MAQAWFATGPEGLSDWELREVDVPAPGPGEVTIRVRAIGMNPADVKYPTRPDATFPFPIGYEVSGEITALGAGTQIGSGAATVGDEVLAFRLSGGYATELTVPAEKVFAKPSTLAHPEAANLFLAGATAAELLELSGARSGDTVLFHAASGAVGVSFLQQAAVRGVRVVGTAGERNADVVRRYGGIPITYGPGLVDRAKDAAAGASFVASLDGVGTDEAIEASLALVEDRTRIITIVRRDLESEGIVAIGGMLPASAAFRDAVRGELVDLARRGLLEVPVARTFPFADAVQAARFLMEGHPGGKLALLP
ncbi:MULTISPECIES: NADP-dependent oxidoreductase [unclassified Microbacterium]|uniref:quinone oxidoreductase family protein n=1 Tax=unclassified Microbacterium TaxID=2609290 RepID=UPI00037E0995|nr:NADP-dependent oxidoreductase [Microbacterium sp. 77mftsu3.1]SDH04052.1 NADPH:quinone reductase [Microbacterium sp. 77mftsu3.1]